MTRRLTVCLAASLVAAGCARSPRAVELEPGSGVSSEAAAAPATRPAFDRSVPPVLAAPPALALPPVLERTLPNGMRLLIVEHHELPIADFILLVGTGGEADPGDKPGVATLVASMLQEGTTSRSALEIAAQEAMLGASVSSSGGWDVSRVMLHVPTFQLDSALALFADVALNPSFPPDELERLRKQRLTSLLQLRDRGPAIADRAYAAILYGDDHPYGRPLGGTEAATEATTRADLESFYRTYYRPNNSTLIVVGDVAPADIEARVGRLFGAWQRREVPRTTYSRPSAASGTTVYLIDKPGAPQSSVRIGGIGVPRSTDDYFALEVMNTILGGSFTSRLNQNLRETRGYTYGAGSSFAMRREAGPFTAYAEVTGTKTDSALIEFMKELRAILDAVPQSELEKAKTYLQLGLPGDFETTRDIGFRLAPVVTYGLPLDYYDSYVQRIEQVTQADIQRVARKYIDPARLAIIIVGDRASVEPALRALNLGPVTLRDMTGREIVP
ncbi:MAG TPA: pitrilysin family protein [Gemmatimonadaceae bacterium]|nr:pitrilysin family protein [Gemmatimonadaceae bacterium]